MHVETKGGDRWGQYNTLDEAVALKESLHPRGLREGPLRLRLGHVSHREVLQMVEVAAYEIVPRVRGLQRYLFVSCS